MYLVNINFKIPVSCTVNRSDPYSFQPGSASALILNPDPHQSDELDPEPDPVRLICEGCVVVVIG